MNYLLSKKINKILSSISSLSIYKKDKQEFPFQRNYKELLKKFCLALFLLFAYLFY